MKKIIPIIAVLIMALVINVSAQKTNTVPGGATGYEFENVMISSLKLNEGANTVPVPNNRGTVKFTKRGNAISNVVYTDAAGKTVKLQPNNGTTEGAPKPECKTKLPDACFGTADKNIGMCMCKPDAVSNGGATETSYYMKIQIRGQRIPVKS